jgi:prepilin-type N-terminal cleavage/methylation domain-containing protein
MNKGKVSKRGGFGILELLVVIAIIGILAVIAIPKFFSARNRAQDRSAETYASAVYKVAFAYISENIGTPVVTDPDCSDGYIAGGYDAGAPGGTVQSCSVTIGPDGGPLIQVVSVNGRPNTLPLP